MGQGMEGSDHILFPGIVPVCTGRRNRPREIQDSRC